jgi:hypothetical protein
MRDMRRPKRPLLLALGACVLVALVAIPVLAAGPRGPLSSASPAASAAPSAAAGASSAPAAASTAPERVKPSKAPKPERAANPAKPEKQDETPVTLTGKVGTRTNADGETEYTLTVGAKVLALDAGPSWFYGDKHPLKPFVRKTVTVVGEQEAGKDAVDVRSVDGILIRADGKPPWAGGWKRVGKNHPGWSQEKWDKWQAKVAEKKARFGVDCWPPGLCKTPGTTNSTTDEPRSGGN